MPLPQRLSFAGRGKGVGGGGGGGSVRRRRCLESVCVRAPFPCFCTPLDSVLPADVLLSSLPPLPSNSRI